jgi:hypothetical protein
LHTRNVINFQILEQLCDVARHDDEVVVEEHEVLELPAPARVVPGDVDGPGEPVVLAQPYRLRVDAHALRVLLELLEAAVGAAVVDEEELEPHAAPELGEPLQQLLLDREEVFRVVVDDYCKYFEIIPLRRAASRLRRVA